MIDDFDNERFRKLLRAYPAKAIEFLYDKYHQPLLRLARYFTRNNEIAEDIVQETFMHVWENYKQLSNYHQSSIKYYLFRIVRNKGINQFNNILRALKHKVNYRNNHSHNTDDSFESRIIKTEINLEVRGLLNTFPRRERECILMKIDDELTNRQIAIQLRISIKSVERSITSANKRFRKHGLNNLDNFSV